MKQPVPAVSESDASVRRMLGSAADGACVESSAFEVLPAMNWPMFEALGTALADVAPELRISRVSGYVDADDCSWKQLVLDVGGPPPGTDEWRRVIQQAGEVMDTLVTANPGFRESFDQIAFDF